MVVGNSQWWSALFTRHHRVHTLDIDRCKYQGSLDDFVFWEGGGIKSDWRGEAALRAKPDVGLTVAHRL